MRKLLISATMLMLSVAGYASVDVIPMPQSVVQTKGSYNLTARPLLYAIKGGDAPTLERQLSEMGIAPAKKASKATLAINVGNDGASEAYTLRIGERAVTIQAQSAVGAFYALQTLRQLIDNSESGLLECATIEDTPRFGYRGMHFDVSRHFRSVDFLKKQIDAMARLKLNRMHLHLTDGAGWRIKIDKYPRLTEYAAWRPETSWSDWSSNGARYCESTQPGAYGGYYTREQLADLIRYAADRHIEVIPEIEMPGHSEEVIAAYPNLGCDVEGTTSDFCPGKEETFEFLQSVLDEVMDIFPSKYIHIGGDEASKTAWRKCDKCKARMEAEGLADVDELQSYLIKRIERYVNSHGRNIIGWDEILEGGVAPNATVMSWRGTEGGIRAMREGHDVVMTPGEFCYLDYCQDAPFKEPISIGGYTPLEKVYSYEPVDPSISAEEAAHLLGVQGNLWSEYITDDAHAERMYYPRMYALAEVAWSPADRRDYQAFKKRAEQFNDRMQEAGYAPFDIRNEYGQRRESLAQVNHLARGAKVIYASTYNDKYRAAGDSTFTDGILGGWTYGDKRWQGTMRDMDVTIDLGEAKPIHYVDAAFMHSEGAWVHLPESVTYEVSTDGENFTSLGTVWCDVDPTYPKIMMKSYGVPADTTARYIRMKATRNPRPGAWLFLDEIIVN